VRAVPQVCGELFYVLLRCFSSAFRGLFNKFNIINYWAWRGFCLFILINAGPGFWRWRALPGTRDGVLIIALPGTRLAAGEHV
jgi:hypothetical protein